MAEPCYSHVIECFIWELQETSWIRTTETSLGVSFETYLRRRGDVLMGRRHYVPLGRCHDIPIRCREDVPLRRLGDVPLRRRGCFIWDVPTKLLGRTKRGRYDVAATSCCPVGRWSSFLRFKKLIFLEWVLSPLASMRHTCVIPAKDLRL